MPELYSIEEDHPILEKLIQGNKNWIKANNLVHPHQEARNSVEFISGQNPDIIVITCSDSRVIPEFIFDARLGELFVIRIAGNVITEEVVASIEFAVDELEAKLIVVLGHQNCGAVQSKLSIENMSQEQLSRLSPNMKQLIDKIEIAESNETDRFNLSVKVNAEYQLRQILKKSEQLFKFTQKNTLDLCAGIYWIESRRVEFI